MWFDQLRQMKEESGLTTREIAERSHVPEPTLEKLFAGITKNPKFTTLQRLVHFFGYNLGDLDDRPRTFSREARKLASDYEKLDQWGKIQLRSVAKNEKRRVTQIEREAASESES